MEFVHDWGILDLGALKQWYERNLAADYVNQAINGHPLATRAQTLASVPANLDRKYVAKFYSKVAAEVVSIDSAHSGLIAVVTKTTTEMHVRANGGTTGSKPKSDILKSSTWQRDTWERTPKGLELARSAILANEVGRDGQPLQKAGTVPHT